MTTLAPIKPTPSKPSFAYNAKKTIRNSSVLSAVVFASFVGGGSMTTSSINPTKINHSDSVTISEGVVEVKTLPVNENVNKNEVNFTVIKNPVSEYDNSNRLFGFSSNGSLLEENKMKKPYDYSTVEQVCEANFKAEPYSTFEIEEEEIAFTEEFNYDFTQITVSQESGWKNELSVEKFDV